MESQSVGHEWATFTFTFSLNPIPKWTDLSDSTLVGLTHEFLSVSTCEASERTAQLFYLEDNVSKIRNCHQGGTFPNPRLISTLNLLFLDLSLMSHHYLDFLWCFQVFDVLFLNILIILIRANSQAPFKLTWFRIAGNRTILNCLFHLRKIR